MTEWICNDCNHEWMADDWEYCPKCISDNVDEVEDEGDDTDIDIPKGDEEEDD